MEFEDVKQKNLFETGPLTVGKFVEQLNLRIKPLAAKLIGEVSDAKPGSTGHIIFPFKHRKRGPG